MRGKLTEALSEILTDLSEKSDSDQAAFLAMLPDVRKRTERDRDIKRKRAAVSEAARVEIDYSTIDWERRRGCLEEPERFLITYFPQRYRLAFGKHHLDMIETVVSRARYGGRQAVAAPRGCGKSELVKGLLVYLVLAGLVRFPLPVAATSDLAKKIYADFRTKLSANDLLNQDFPEVCTPVRALDGASQRAGKQHIDGVPTRIVWKANDYLSLPFVNYPEEMQDITGEAVSPYGGVKMAYYGLDSAFRGVNIDGNRPDFVLIDDPETRESAKSPMQCEDRENVIDQDIAGLASQEENLAIVVLTTIQNCNCLSFRLTDPKAKPAFNGLRFGMIAKWPKNMELWDEYVSIRHKDQSEGDEHGQTAVKHYLANRKKMDAGVEMLSDHFVPVTLEDGTELVHSAIQQAFNRIADTSLEAYKTEYQNDPTPDLSADTLGLTAAIVANRISGLEKNELPNNGDCTITMGLDMGDHFGHWVKVAWFGNASGCVIDYGVMEVAGIATGMSKQAREVAMLKSLIDFHPQALAENPPEFAFIDAGDGDHQDAVFEFVRQVMGDPWAACKGWDTGRFRLPDHKPDKRPFKECWAHFLRNEGLWLYHMHGEWWKQWLQTRFATPTFDDQQQFNDGSLSLFAIPHSKKKHLSFSHHIVSEERQEKFVEGKGLIRKWVQVSKNNHYLDAAAMACAAAGCLGVELIKRDPVPINSVREREREFRPMTTPDGRAYLATER